VAPFLSVAMRRGENRPQNPPLAAALKEVACATPAAALNVRFWHIAEIADRSTDVRFWR